MKNLVNARTVAGQHQEQLGRWCFLLAVVLAAPLGIQAQVSVSPGPTTVTLNTATSFTFTVNVPSGGTAVNWATVRFYQSASSSPSATTAWCGFNLTPYTGSNGNQAVAIGGFNADGSSNADLYPPNLWTTAAQRTNSLCSLAAENLITYTINASASTMSVTIPITFFSAAAFALDLHWRPNVYLTLRLLNR